MQNIIIADNQDITRAGMAYVLSTRGDVASQVASNKSELILRLTDCPNRFLCQHATNMILAPEYVLDKEGIQLTKTEVEILKEIATGMTTREIAEKRFSSFHTVNTHRKNIFRKLGVNNVHEAIRYAMRSGLVDAAEYYI